MFCLIMVLGIKSELEPSVYQTTEALNQNEEIDVNVWSLYEVNTTRQLRRTGN